MIPLDAIFCVDKILKGLIFKVFHLSTEELRSSTHPSVDNVTKC